MGVETSGPSEEDLKIRPGEPNKRLQDAEEAHGLANDAVEARKQAKYLKAVADDKFETARSYEHLRINTGDIDKAAKYEKSAGSAAKEWQEYKAKANDKDEEARKLEEE